jgi:DMSO/TMAO reductase YedYZ heme-binding membrane subunit
MTAMRMRAGTIWLVMALVCCAPIIVWGASVNDPMAYLRGSGLPSGQQLYLLAKLAGLLAFSLFWLQCMLTLARYAPKRLGFPMSDLWAHKCLGIATALLIFGHVGSFIGAASARTGHLAAELLLPSFTQGHYKLYVGLGAIAFWLVCATVFAGWQRARGVRRWRAVHQLWPLVFGLVFLHAFCIGSESRYGAMRYLMIFMVLSLGIAGVARFLYSRRRLDGHSTFLRPESGVTR